MAGVKFLRQIYEKIFKTTNITEIKLEIVRAVFVNQKANFSQEDIDRIARKILDQINHDEAGNLNDDDEEDKKTDDEPSPSASSTHREDQKASPADKSEKKPGWFKRHILHPIKNAFKSDEERA